MYADDTAVYYATSDINIVERKMSENFKCIVQNLDDSELVTNLKKRKGLIYAVWYNKKIINSQQF